MPLPQENRHDVFWGSHGCRRRKGHANPCRCTCGTWYLGTPCYGDDAVTAVARVDVRMYYSAICQRSPRQVV